MNIIIRTEERPKKSTLATIFNTFCNTHLTENDIDIYPILHNGNFTFTYKLLIPGFDRVSLELVSGTSSFIDYLIIEVDDLGNERLIAMIEETKTDDSESRNTGIYQRASKFIYANLFYPFIPKYMLYISENDNNRIPSETAQFGTKLLKTIGVQIIGKNDYYNSLLPFKSIDEIINFKNNMRRPPVGNTPILITRDLTSGSYSISGILSKPKEEGNIAHDPNIGALTLISAGIRKFDPYSPIYITHHCVSQSYIENTYGNKFLYIASYLNIILSNLIYNPQNFNIASNYYYNERSSEKITTIFLHIVLERIGAKLIYENHAGCERGYFHTNNGIEIALPKKVNSQQLYIPDLIMQLPTGKVLIIEGKKLSTLYNGINELKNYNLIENYYIKPDYNNPIIERWVTTFGGNLNQIPHEKVLIHINSDGTVFINSNAPYELKNYFNIF